MKRPDAWLRIAATILLAPAALLACASIIHGTKQEVSIASSPSGAQVMVDNMTMGNTPVVADLRRKNEHHIVVRLEGYEPFELNTKKSFSGWYIGNIVFGGIIGLIVDAANGAMYNVSPDDIQAALSQTNAQARVEEDGTLYVILVPKATPEPHWRKIGQMNPLP